MDNVTAELVSNVAKRFLLRAMIWIVVAMLLYGVSEWVQTAYWPTVSTDMAMGQMEDSDAAFVQMQTAEQAKNSFSTISVLLVVMWSVVVWLDYATRSWFKVSKLMQEEDE